MVIEIEHLSGRKEEYATRKCVIQNYEPCIGINEVDHNSVYKL